MLPPKGYVPYNPNKKNSGSAWPEEIDRLSLKLQGLIKEQDFEKATKVRDRITKLLRDYENRIEDVPKHDDGRTGP